MGEIADALKTGGVPQSDWLTKNPPKPPPQQDKGLERKSDFMAGLRSGGNQMQALGGGIVAMAGDAFDSDYLVDKGLDIYEANMREAGETAPRVDMIEDIKGVGDTVDYAQGILGKLVPNLLTMAAGGGIGGAVAKTVAKKVVKQKISKEAAKKIAKKGRTGGAIAAAMGMSSGEIYGDVASKGEEGVKAIASALAGGVLAGTLESAAPLFVAKKLGIADNLLKKITQKASDPNIIKRVAKTTGKVSAFEAATEVAQTLIEEGTKAFILEEAMPDDLNSLLLNSLVAGAVGGGAMGAPAGLRGDPRPSEPPEPPGPPLKGLPKPGDESPSVILVPPEKKQPGLVEKGGGQGRESDSVQLLGLPAPGKATNPAILIPPEKKQLGPIEKGGRQGRGDEKVPILKQEKNYREPSKEALKREYEALKTKAVSPEMKADIQSRIDTLADKKKKLTVAQRAQERRRVDVQQDDLVTVIRKMGGIDTSIETDWQGRLSHLNKLNKVFGLPGIERKGGMLLDDAAERLLELGYLKGQSKDQTELADLLYKAEDGTKIYSSHKQARPDIDIQAEQDHYEQQERYEQDKKKAETMVGTSEKGRSIKSLVGELGGLNEDFKEADAITSSKSTDKEKAIKLYLAIKRAKTKQLTDAKKEVDQDPTEAQKEAGNYKLGHVRVRGHNISIENPKGSTRSGKDESGRSWSNKIKSNYGYIKGTKANDGDHVDTFISDRPDDGGIYIIEQVDKNGKHDEFKVMMGFKSEAEAGKKYLENYDKNWNGYVKSNGRPKAVTMNDTQFKEWVYSDQPKKGQINGYTGSSVQPVRGQQNNRKAASSVPMVPKEGRVEQGRVDNSSSRTKPGRGENTPNTARTTARSTLKAENKPISATKAKQRSEVAIKQFNKKPTKQAVAKVIKEVEPLHTEQRAYLNQLRKVFGSKPEQWIKDMVVTAVNSFGGKKSKTQTEKKIPNKQRVDESQAKKIKPQAKSAARTQSQDKPAPKEKSQGARIKNVQVSKFRTGVSLVKTPADAAHVLAPSRKAAQETLSILMTDSKGKPIAIARHTVGGISSASVFPGVIAGVIHSTPGVKNVWLSHNHPSGQSKPSNADRSMTKKIGGLISGTGVDYRGHIIIGGNEFTALDVDGKTVLTEKIKPLPRKTTVPITERRIVKQAAKGDAITSTKSATKAVLKFSKGEAGIILTDNQNRPVGFLPMALTEMRKLRTGKIGTGASALFKALSDANAAAVLVALPSGKYERKLSDNMARVFSSANYRLLDIFDGLKSMTERGLMLPHGEQPYYSKSPFKQTGGMLQSEAQAQAAKITANWKNAPTIKVVQSQSELPIGILDAAKKQDANTIHGVYYGGRAYIVADNVTTETLPGVIFHEAIGHHGVRRVLGADAVKTLNDLYDSLGKIKGISRIAKKYGHNLTDYWTGSKDMPLNTRKVLIVDELIAHLTQNQANESFTPRVKRLVSEWIAIIKRFLGVNTGKDDLISLIANIKTTVIRGKQQIYTPINDTEVKTMNQVAVKQRTHDAAPRFSMTKDQSETLKKANGVVKKWLKRNFTKEGLRNKQIFELGLKSDADKMVGEKEIESMVYDLNKSVAKAFGVKRYNDVKDSDLSKVNDFLAGENVDLPQALKESLGHMRSYLDAQSMRMLQAIQDMKKIDYSNLNDSNKKKYMDGKIPKGIAKHHYLYEKIKSNLGTYLTRSYQAFDDKKWKEKALANKGLMARAEAFIQEQNTELTKSEVTAAVSAILQNAKNNGNFMSLVSKGVKQGGKDVSILNKKKKVPAIIRELLGEYKDPRVNFVRSSTKMHWFVANHKFLMKMREGGRGVYLFDRPDIVNGVAYDDPVAGDSSETMNPLNGLYTSEDINTGLKDAVGGFEGSDLMRNIIKLNSAVKYGKTILAPTTQLRNFYSASVFTIMNGHFDWSHMGKAFKATKSDLLTQNKEWRKYINKLIKLGVIHNNPYAGELRDAIRDFTEMDLYSKTPYQKGKQILNFAQKAYQVGDDFWKIVGYENELAMQKKKGLSGKPAEERAAYVIRNGYPTYSMVPRFVKMVRRWPLIGTFVSFPYEIIRTSYNQLGFLRDDIKAGHKEAAASRLLGMSIASAVSYAISQASMAAMGINDEDDEAIRAQLPPWSRNSQLFYVNYDKDGLPVYMDLSYIDPYTYLKKPITAILNGNNEGFVKKFGDAAQEFLDPFVGPDIAAGAIGEVIFNKRMGTGSPVYNEEGSATTKATAIINHIRKAGQPGVLSNIERTIKAIEGDASRSGKKYDIGDEGLAWIGFRFGTLNLPQSMRYKGYGFISSKRSASSILNRVAGSASKVSDKKLKRAFTEMITARELAYKKMIKMVTGAKKLQVPEEKVIASLRSAGVSKKDISLLIKGKTPQWNPTARFLKRNIEGARATVASKSRAIELEIELMRRKKLIRQYAQEYYK